MGHAVMKLGSSCSGARMIHRNGSIVTSFPYYYYESKHTWREIDRCERRWNNQDDFIISYIIIIYSCF